MSTPIHSREAADESLLYAPRWARRLPAAGEPTSGSERAIPAMIEDSPGMAPDITQPTWVSPAMADSPPMAPGLGAPNIGLPPAWMRPFEGDLAVKDLRDRLSRDPHLALEPPLTARPSPILPWLGRWSLVLLFAGVAGFGIRLVTLPDATHVDTGALVEAVAPLFEGLRMEGAEPARLIVETRRAYANEPLPLGVSLNAASGDEIVTLVGLARGTRLTAGSALGLTGWQLPARDLERTLAHAPKDFVGFMDAAVDLRSRRDRLMDSQFVRLEWMPKTARTAPAPPAPPISPGSALAAVEAPPLAPEEAAALLRRGEDFFKSGDVPSARIALRRAAQSGNVQAALALGATFDPLLLAEHGVIGLAPDVAQARHWYQRAAALGSAEAARRLERLAGS
jgi:hypothetical protein